VVDTATPLDVVVTEMARRGLGCAIVVKHDKLVGILTMTDVCRHLAERLRGDRTGDDDVA
jgi:CBS domain-containing protein